MADPIDRLSAALSDRYRIERELGAGGMATVYLAEDVKHDRKVAVKVLRPELAAVLGADRFVQEIKTTAALQHPHILPLFDSGEADGFLFYVMPYIEGETLRDKLNRETQFSVDEAVQITTEVADALDYAHRHGVVHRDIKPENILLHDGRPMVADFGIALALSAAAGGRMTETGMSLGTPHYMSPEQATADKDITGRSDIYSLASMLYEMLTGEPPHMGNSAQQIIMKIIAEEVKPVTSLRKSVPPNITAALAQALEKLPADRFSTASDFAHALTDRGFRRDEADAAAGAAGSGLRWNRLAVGFAALAVVLAAALAWSLLRPAPPAPVSRYGLAFAPGQKPVDLSVPAMALAPDGSSIVYVGPGSQNNQLWVKQRDRFKATPLSGTDGAVAPSVSPDGRWVLYEAPGNAGEQLRKVPIVGGASVVMADSVNSIGRTGAAWLDDGSIVYVDAKWHLRRIPAGGGAADSVWAPPDDRFLIFPRALPDSKGMLFTVCDANCQTVKDIWALDFRTGKAHRVVSGAVLADYTSIGRIVYVRSDGSVFAAPFDLTSLKTTGPAAPVLQGVKVIAGIVPDFALSRSGTLLMTAGPGGSGLAQFVWVTRTGMATPVDSTWTFDPGDANMGWALSPNGKQLALRIHAPAGDNIWIKQLPHGPLSRLTFDSAGDWMPHWTPDGRSVTFGAMHGGKHQIWTKRADGVGAGSLVFADSNDFVQGFWSPDGKWLVLRTGGNPGVNGGRNILIAHPGKDSIPTPILADTHDETAPAISPDSRWIAYVSNETGHRNVFVRPFPDVNDGKWQISTDGGDAPLWAHDGREIFFIDAKNNVVDASIRTTPSFAVGTSKVLFHLDDEYVIPTWCCRWDIAPDDQRFLMARVAGSGRSADERIIVVENWLAELKKAVAK